MDIDSDFVDNIKACRTCGIHYVTPSKNQLRHLFQSCQEHSEINLIRLELSQWNVEVAENDGFPQYVCNTCIHRFEQVFQLRAACINAQNEFRKFYAVPNGNNPNIKIKTELPEPDEAAPICDFIYVDELSDTEYDGATPFNYPHIPIKEEVIEAATIPMEDSQQPTNLVESASRIVVQAEPELVSHNESVGASQSNAVVQIAANEVECSICQYVCSNQEEHQQHMQSAHGIVDLECHICGKEFKNSTIARLKFHMKWHTLNKQIKCTFCGFLCNSKKVLTEHKRANHRKLNCKVCGKGVLTKKMKSHLRQHEVNSKYSCEYCTEAFPSEIERENHIWEIHANEDNGASNSMANLQTNYSQTINENSAIMKQADTFCQEPQDLIYKFVCAQCEHRFINQIDLETHVNEEHRTNLTKACEMTQNEGGEDNKQGSIAVFAEYDNDNEIHIPANDSSINNSAVLHQELSLPTCSRDLVNQNENVQSAITESTTNSSSDEKSDREESENETNINLSSYVESNLNTFACAKCPETFVAIEQLRQHHEQHLAATDQQQQMKTSTKLKFQCSFCVKSFDLKFKLNRHLKKHKHAPF